MLSLIAVTGMSHAGENSGQAKWLWSIPKPRDNSNGYFRYKFTVESPVKRAELLLCVDDRREELYINDVLVAKTVELKQTPKPIRIQKFEVTDYLNEGNNLIALNVRNAVAAAGIIVKLDIEYLNGKKKVITTDGEWRSSDRLIQDWEKKSYDDLGWGKAAVLGDVSCKPWDSLSNVQEFFLTEAEKQNRQELESQAEAWVKNVGGVPPGDGIGWTKWIWYPEIARAIGKSVRYFRHEFELGEAPARAEMLVCIDDRGKIFINGAEPAKKVNYPQPVKAIQVQKYDLTGQLVSGRNVIAFSVENLAVDAGVIAAVDITYSSGKTTRIVTDGEWKSAKVESPGFTSAGFDDSKWEKVWVIGDALIYPWQTVSNASMAFLTPEEWARHRAMERAAQNIGATLNLAAEPDTVARIAWNGKQAGIEINGEILPPYFHLVWHETRYRGMFLPRNGEAVSLAKKAGVNLVQYSLNLDLCIPAPGKWNSAYIKNNTEAVNRLLAANPDARLILAIDFRAPEWWLNANPDECVKYVTGPAKYQEDAIHRMLVPSMASDIWSREAVNTLEKMLAEFKKELWWKRVAGFRVNYGVYGEWHYYGMSRHMPDISAPMTKKFREYLAAKYGSDDALRKAWQDPEVTLKTASVPGKEERQNKQRFMRTPTDGKDRQTMDYYDCQQKVTADLLIHWAGEAKRLAPGKLVGAWYGYVFEMSYPADGQTVEYERVLSSSNIDFLSSPYCYNRVARRPGGDGQMRIISAPFNRHGKLAFFEDDSRTHLAGAPHELSAQNPVESEAILKRNLGLTLVNRIGLQFNDGGNFYNIRGWFSDDAQLRTIKRSGEIWKELQGDSRPVTHGEVAVIYDPRELVRHNHTVHPVYMIDALSDSTLHAMRHTGYSVETFTLTDYLELDHPFKLVVMLNSFSPSAEERAKLKTKLQREGTMAVWIYAPGLMTENGFSDTAMSELTEINLVSQLEKLPLTVMLKDKRIMEYSRKLPLMESPRVQVADPAAELWGYYVNDSTPAMAVKKLHNRRMSVFSGAPITDKTVWSMIFELSGVHRYGTEETIVYSNGTQMLVHTGKAGRYPVKFPRKGTIVELYSGKVLASDSDKVILASSGPDTWLLDLR